MDTKAQNRKIARRLALVAVGMFGFGFALWPLYNVFCEVTGFGGRAIQVGTSNEEVAVSDRNVKIRFDASVNSSLPWHFQAKEKVGEYQLGEPSIAYYLAMNPDDETITGQATYNVSPPEASLYFVKTECFCFTEQTLKAHESREMPVYFYIKPDLPEHIRDITLSYTFYRQGYELTDQMAQH
ncbi:MAG: cytochrome c oxidase assembly protein [Xanthomonadales bacterium]|nr:cytochrome c oxidase assembly protein [Xanthomonadales bacterium]